MRLLTIVPLLNSAILASAKVCTLQAQGYELLDDSPTINAALRDCGTGSTIVFPSDQAFSIRSPIDFSPCQDCDIQIEGQLVVSRGDWDYWNSEDRSVFTIAEGSGIKVRSVTGKGVINGNARDYYNRGWRMDFLGPHLLHITNSSSNIHVSGLTLKDAPMRFIRLDGNVASLHFSSLNFTVAGQYPLPPVSESETFGFEMGDVSNVTIEDVEMEFHAQGNIAAGDTWDHTVGICIAFDRGTSGINVKNVRCTNAWRGVVVMIGTSIYNYNSSPARYPALTGHGVSDILVQNLTFSGDTASGYLNYPSPNDTVRNVTWDGVNVVSGSAVTGERCYLRCHCITIWHITCEHENWKESFEEIEFKNFRGNVGAVPGPGWGCAPNQTKCDIEFSGWKNTTLI